MEILQDFCLFKILEFLTINKNKILKNLHIGRISLVLEKIFYNQKVATIDIFY